MEPVAVAASARKMLAVAFDPQTPDNLARSESQRRNAGQRRKLNEVDGFYLLFGVNSRLITSCRWRHYGSEKTQDTDRSGLRLERV